LDYWLRVNCAANPDAKQAVNKAVDHLLETIYLRPFTCNGTF
jgi:hypothetical protein